MLDNLKRYRVSDEAHFLLSGLGGGITEEGALRLAARPDHTCNPTSMPEILSATETAASGY